MPIRLLSGMTLPPATIWSVPINDYAIANEGLAVKTMEGYYSCCGKSICRGCEHSFNNSGTASKCPFCNSNRGKTAEEGVADMMKRVEANDAASIFILGDHYYQGIAGIQQDCTKAMELYYRSAELGYGKAHSYLAQIFRDEGDMKKAKFHVEAAAMAGHEPARCIVGNIEFESGNTERAVKHWTIAASAGNYIAMHVLRTLFDQGVVCRELIDSTLMTYNNSCAEMRSEARDASIHAMIETI
jgi:TPR repeat protein